MGDFLCTSVQEVLTSRRSAQLHRPATGEWHSASPLVHQIDQSTTLETGFTLSANQPRYAPDLILLPTLVLDQAFQPRNFLTKPLWSLGLGIPIPYPSFLLIHIVHTRKIVAFESE